MSEDARKTVEYVVPVGVVQKWVLNVRLSGPFPLKPGEWDRLIDVLETMKPGLVTYDAKLRHNDEKETNA